MPAQNKISKLELLKIKFLRWLGHQDWLRYAIRYHIIMPGADIDQVFPYDFRVDFFGAKYKGNLKNHIDWRVYFYGAYEKAEVLLLQKILLSLTDPVVLDIGANTGHHSLFFSRYAAQVHSFEPYQAVRDILQNRLAENNVSNVIVHPLGLADVSKELEYYAPITNNTGTGSFIGGLTENKLLGKLAVVAADEYLPRLNLKKIDLIKVDAEGFEKEILTGLQNTLKKYRPIVFLEFGTATRHKFSSAAELTSLLPENYQVFNVSRNFPLLFFFNRMSCRLDSFDYNKPSENILIVPNESRKY